MSTDQPITDRRSRPTPEPGTRWIDYVPSWVRIALPACTVLITLVGFSLGWGEGHGRAEAQIGGLESRAERYERQRDSDLGVLWALRSEVAALSGEVRAIGRALGVASPPVPSRLPEPGPVVREAPEVVP
jgi:hypothetical protein